MIIKHEPYFYPFYPPAFAQHAQPLSFVEEMNHARTRKKDTHTHPLFVADHCVSSFVTTSARPVAFERSLIKNQARQRELESKYQHSQGFTIAMCHEQFITCYTEYGSFSLFGANPIQKCLRNTLSQMSDRIL